MPELAEVQTVKDVLKKQILNKKIKDIKIIYPKIIENDLEYFKFNLINSSFIDIKTKGKYLIFETKDFYLISHLRMEGKYFIKDKNDEINKHEHVIFYFDDFTLRYHDTRKFGRMKLILKKDLDLYFKNIGPDCNICDDEKYLYNKIFSSNKHIKTLLLDQSIIAGLGNIYVDEVLYKSFINPLRQGKDISLKECQSILKNSKEILNKAIEYKGTTIRSYTSSLGVFGEYQKFLCVHTKEKCPKDHTLNIEKINGRTSYFCSKCQK